MATNDSAQEELSGRVQDESAQEELSGRVHIHADCRPLKTQAIPDTLHPFNMGGWERLKVGIGLNLEPKWPREYKHVFKSQMSMKELFKRKLRLT